MSEVNLFRCPECNEVIDRPYAKIGQEYVHLSCLVGLDISDGIGGTDNEVSR